LKAPRRRIGRRSASVPPRLFARRLDEFTVRRLQRQARKG